MRPLAVFATRRRTPAPVRHTADERPVTLVYLYVHDVDSLAARSDLTWPSSQPSGEARSSTPILTAKRLRIAHSTRRLTVICGSHLHAQCRTAGSVVTAMTWDVERAYREHLTSGDLALLSDVVGGQPLMGALSSPGLEQIVFGLDAQFDSSRSASPFLTFAVAVYRVAERLTVTTYVNE